MTLEDAQLLVKTKLKEKEQEAEIPLAIIDAKTSEASFGWVFHFTSQRHLQTGDRKYLIAGNGPIFVNKATGEVRFNGPIPSLEKQIASYEKELADKSAAN